MTTHQNVLELDSSLETSDLFEHKVFFLDSSLPKLLSRQLKGLLVQNKAEIADPVTPHLDELLSSISFNHPANQVRSASDASTNSKQTTAVRHQHSKPLIKSLKPRFDLTTTTHVVTNSLQLPEYQALGLSDEEGADLLSFTYIPPKTTLLEDLGIAPPEPELVTRRIYLVTPLWVTQSYDLHKILAPKAYSPDPYKFFSGIVVALDSTAKLPSADVEMIRASLRAWGGQHRSRLTREVTHLISSGEGSKDYEIAMKVKDQIGLKVVLPHWFHHSVFFRTAISEAPFEFPEPPVMRPASPLNSPDFQHGVNEFPGSKLPCPSQALQDPEIDQIAYKTATQLAFAAQNLSSRPVSQGLSDYLEATCADPCKPSQSSGDSFERSCQLPKDIQLHPAFQDHTVYLASTLGLTLAARNTLKRQIEKLGARVFAAPDLPFASQSTRGATKLSEEENLRRGMEAESQLRNSDVVICERRAGWEFWLAWELRKEIGTLHWILNILNTSSSSLCAKRPSFERLLDFPCPVGNIAGWIETDKPITITNYSGPTRSYLTKLLDKMNLKFSGCLDFNTSLLVAANKAGNKVEYAVKRGIQIVNHIYIEECFQSWTKPAIQQQHILYPDGVNLVELVGRQTLGLESISRWAKRADVREQMKLDLSRLPSRKEANRSNQLPCELMESSSRLDILPLMSPGATNKSGSTLHGNQRQEATSHTHPVAQLISETSSEVSAQQPLVCNGCKPSLLSKSSEFFEDNRHFGDSPQPTDDDQDSNSHLEPVCPTNDSAPSRGSDSAEKPTSREVGHDYLDPSTTTSEKKAQAEDDLTPLPSPASLLKSCSRQKVIPKAPGTSESFRKRLESRSPNRPESLAKSLTLSALESSGTTPKALSKSTSALTRQPTKRDGRPAPASNEQNTPPTHFEPRSSSRKAAQTAAKKLTSAAEDMNAHAKEKKRKRLSGAGLAGAEDGGYFADVTPGGRPSTSSKRKAVDSLNNQQKRADCTKENSTSSPQTENLLPNHRELPAALAERRTGHYKLPAVASKAPTYDSDDSLPGSSELDALLLMSAPKARKGKAVSPAQRLIKAEEDPPVPAASTSNSKRAKVKQEELQSKRLPQSSKVCILQTGERLPEKLCNKLLQIGATMTESPNQCTHLLTNKIARTEKFIMSVVKGCHIVGHSWAKACADAGALVGEEEHMLKDESGERKHKFKLKDSLDRARNSKILEGELFHISPKVPPNVKLLKSLIEAAGGKVITRAPLVKDIRGHSERHVISCHEDIRFWKPLTKRLDDEDDIPIYTQDLILQGLLTQNMDYSQHQLDLSGST